MFLLAATIFPLISSFANHSTVQQGELQGIYTGTSIQAIERGLSMYLNGEEIQSVLTPGEFVEWKLPMKAGQVVVADAHSDAFDPGLEIVDSAGKSLDRNDDRYPGDQRPLLFWRCTQDGQYTLRVRSFANKGGGKVFVRFKTYGTIDITSGDKVDGVFDATQPFFVRIPMKAGQVKDLVADRRGEGNYLNFNFDLVVSPNGLPEREPSIAQPIYPAIFPALIAPVAGDYYLLARPYGYVGGSGRVRIGTRDFVPIKPSPQGNAFTAKAPTNTPALFELDVKKGDLLEASTPDLNLNSAFRVAEAPDFSAFDTSKPETNPFFPILKNQPPGNGPALDLLPGRVRDGRVVVFRARRDAKLWIASDGAGPADRQFALQIKPAASEFVEDKSNSGDLKVAKTDYWAFDAKAGDVMTFNSSTSGFSPVVVVRDPDLGEIRHAEAQLDQISDSWRMIYQKPGRYLLQISCLGDGGGGAYTLTRKVLHATEFGLSTPAKAEISDGQIQIWKFTVAPNDPVLVHWNSSNWSYDAAIYDDKGQRADFQRQDIDAHNRLGILKVAQPQTFVIVLTGGHDRANYSIELSGLAGYKKG